VRLEIVGAKGASGLMKKIRVGFFIFLIFFAGVCVSAGFCQISADVWPHSNSDLNPDPALVFGALPNGFRYVLMENNRPEGRVSLHLAIQAGSLQEQEHQQGVAHFLEHMMFCGTTHFKPGELVAYFQSLGMRFGPDANAHTGFNGTAYDLFLSDGTSESIEKGLLVLKDFAGGALLLPEEIERERKVVLAEQISRDSADYRTYEASLRFEFDEARISRRQPIGIRSVIQTADQPLLKEFYNAWYVPGNMTLVMVGNFKPAMAESMIEKKFGDLASRTPLEAPVEGGWVGRFDHKGIKPFYHHEKELGNTTISLETLRKITFIGDSKALRQELWTASVADRMLQNRLDSAARELNAPFTDAVAGSGIYLKEVAYAEVSAQTSPENWEKTLYALEISLRSALTHGFAEAELQRVKKDIISELDQEAQKASTRSSRDLGPRIVRYLSSGQVLQSPAQIQTLFAPFIESLDMESVMKVFRKNWADDHLLVLVTGNAELEGKGKTPEDLILSAFEKSRARKVTRPDQPESAVFPYLPLPQEEGAIQKTTKIPDLGITMIDFKNGFRLNLKQTDFEAGEILADLSFGQGDVSQPLDKPGLSALSQQVVNESGLGHMDRDQLNRAMAGKTTRLEFQTREDRFSFSGQTVPAEIEVLFQLLYAHLMDPAYRQQAHDQAMNRFSQEYREMESTVEGGMTLYGKRFLAGGDSRFGLPSHAEFTKLSIEDVRSWIDPAIRNAPIELSVVGDFQTDQVIDLADRYFGSLPPRKDAVEKKKTSNHPVFPFGEKLTIRVPTRIFKNLLIVAYPTEDTWNIERARCFSILAEIFSDRLRQQVRENMGAAYSPFAYNRSSRAYPGYGLFQAMVYSEPEKTDAIISEIHKIAEKLASEKIDMDELERVRTPAVNRIQDMVRRNEYWLNSVLSDSRRYPQQIDWSRSLVQTYVSVRPEQLNQLARTYLNLQKAAVFVAGPKMP